jgi:hypothetical protein
MGASVETNGMVRLPLKQMVIMQLAAISNSAKVIIAVVISNSGKGNYPGCYCRCMVDMVVVQM